MLTKKERIAFNAGHAQGVRDTVAQEKERLALSTAMLIKETANIARGGDHKCSTSGIALAEGMPHANSKCFACALVSFVAATIEAINDTSGPTE